MRRELSLSPVADIPHAMPDRPLLPTFLNLSCRLTGFDVATLQGTGLVEAYHDLVLESLGEEGLRELTDGGGAARRLIRLWYTGHWDGAMVSAAAYRAGLLWRAIGVSPPGAWPPGYGSWSLPPQPS